MDRQLRKMVIVAEEFALHSPAQQLLDRFLMGYRREGQFHRLDGCQVWLHVAPGASGADVERRMKDHDLHVGENLDRTLANADGVILVWRGSGAKANDVLLQATLRAMQSGTPCFVHGALASGRDAARQSAALAKSRGLVLCSGTSTTVTYRLPDVDLPRNAKTREALIVVQGPFPEAEHEALEGLLPVIERRRGGESDVRSVRFVQGDEVWRARREGLWSLSLLAAAVSRSNTVQGDPVKDGRTQDIVGQGLIQSLAKDPRGWLLEHHDRLRTTILVLDGAVADYNFAIHLADGSTVSAQLYRPPEPAQEQFSRLAAVIEDFFRTGEAAWRIERSLLVAGLLDEFRQRRA